MAKNLMIQGTASSVGKSLVTAGLCRVLYQDGYKTAPFKSQNMSLNSFVTDEGLEMGRAQAVQAEAAGIKPEAAMNPILLKPSSDRKSQVIIEGKVLSTMDACCYHDYKKELKKTVMKNYMYLDGKYDCIIIEGAGSPAEINLRENDIVNMGMAEMADSPVILIADIDRGGVFASIAGTIFLLSESEKRRVKGIIINKFRGDIELLKPGIVKIEEMLNIPVLGVIPYTELNIEDEDSLTSKLSSKKEQEGHNEQYDTLDIAVIKVPHISNFTDFDVFGLFDKVSLRFVSDKDKLGNPDMIILPGSKNTIDDMKFLRESGFAEIIKEKASEGIIICGICGGYQMLGTEISDPYNCESDIEKIEGLGLLEMTTVFEKDKITRKTKGVIISEYGIFHGLKGKKISGYEIHMGRSYGKADGERVSDMEYGKDGLISGNVFGTYIHGFFDTAGTTGIILNNIRRAKGLCELSYDESYHKSKEFEYNKLSSLIRNHIDLKEIYKIMGIS